MKGDMKMEGIFINSQFLFLLPVLYLPHLELIKALNPPLPLLHPSVSETKKEKKDEKNILFPQNPLPPPPISG